MNFKLVFTVAWTFLTNQKLFSYHVTAIEHSQTDLNQEYVSYVGFSLDFSMKGFDRNIKVQSPTYTATAENGDTNSEKFYDRKVYTFVYIFIYLFLTLFC